MSEDRVTLAHGNGGFFMRELIHDIFIRHLGNADLNTEADAASLTLTSKNIMVTTDGFTVQPLEFPGGDIGMLAVHGTVNDLAVAGAIPVYLTLNVFIEEGFEMVRLDRIIASLAAAAAADGVRIVAGDTKVLPRGDCGGLYLATTGIGIRRPGLALGIHNIRAGDKILVSGPVGDHGTAVLLAREEFGLRGDLRSDVASVLPLANAIAGIAGLRFMRDPTRGGVATVAHEIARATGLGIRLQSALIPVHEPVRCVCEVLGYDPLFLASEGRVVAVIDPLQAEAALAAWRDIPKGYDAACIGEMVTGDACVVIETELGGERFIEELEDDPLPRIC
jgi:hydrogenase expression/formation protein HypE